MKKVQFTDELLKQPTLSGQDVTTTLRHFAIITYDVDPERLGNLLHPRFLPQIVSLNGTDRALISVVPFLDVDFRFTACPWPQFSFGQTNYRAYVVDTETNENVVWFFGTCLDSRSVLVPQRCWKLPWRRGRIRFDCTWSESESRYLHYRMSTQSDWAPSSLRLNDSGNEIRELKGFPTLESSLVVLTHPLHGYYYRQDDQLGTYSIWHDRLQVTEGSCSVAKFPLLQILGLVSLKQQSKPHSVLIQHETDFTIYLPPRLGSIDDSHAASFQPAKLSTL